LALACEVPAPYWASKKKPGEAGELHRAGVWKVLVMAGQHSCRVPLSLEQPAAAPRPRSYAVDKKRPLRGGTVRHCIKRAPTEADAGTINQPQSLMTRAFDLGENRMGRYLHLLLGLLFLAFGALNALAAENPEKAAVGLGEVCDKKVGPLCKSGLDCNSAEPGKAGVCANATVPEQVVPTTPQRAQ
jgi:hypothetical protein